MDEPLFEQVPIKEQPSAEDKFEQIVKEIKEKKPEPAPAPRLRLKQRSSPLRLPKAPAPAPGRTTRSCRCAQSALHAYTSGLSHAATAQTRGRPGASDDDHSSGLFYVQVGAFFRFTPDKRFIDTIEQNNLTYKLYKIQRDGKEITKVLIGPFSSRQDAANIIGTIRSRINDQAFITKV